MGVGMPGAMGEVGEFRVFVSDNDLLTCEVVGVSIVSWIVLLFGVG